MLHSRWNFVISLISCLCIAFYVERRVLFEPMAINDDVRNQVYWMLRVVDPSLFPNDLAAQYFSQPALVSPFLKSLYILGTQWLDPLQISQFLPFVLVVLATLFLFKFAAQCLNSRYAFWISLIFNIYIWQVANLSGGLPRAFFYPLLFLFLWLLSIKCWGWLVVCFLLQALIYPPVWFICLGLLVVELFINRKHFLANGRQKALVSLAIVGSLLILVQRYGGEMNPYHFGALLTGEAAESMPELYDGGRVEVFRLQPNSANPGTLTEAIHDVLTRLPSLKDIYPLLIVMAGVLLWKRLLRKSMGELTYPGMLWKLVMVSFALYTLAAAFLFIFYVPYRYIQYTLPFALVFFIGSVLYLLEQRLQALRPARLFQVAVSVILVIASIGSACWTWKPDLIKVYSDQKALYDYLGTVEKDAVISAPYTIASNIPTFARRSVLVDREVTIPFHIQYYQEMRRRLSDSMNAYYATEPGPVLHFIYTHHPDYVVLNQRDFKPKKIRQMPSLSYNAFSEASARQALDGEKQGRLLLLNLSTTCQSFQSGPYIVIPTPMLLKCLEHKKS
ncbi:MAG TPA: hypothetical protein V6C52_06705 [Coleofasciculaceae cyanobacterium]|jgi:hypothetical protein